MGAPDKRDCRGAWRFSDVAVGKLCEKLQVPKPPRGYWARVEAGQDAAAPGVKSIFGKSWKRNGKVHYRRALPVILLNFKSKFSMQHSRNFEHVASTLRSKPLA